MVSWSSNNDNWHYQKESRWELLLFLLLLLILFEYDHANWRPPIKFSFCCYRCMRNENGSSELKNVLLSSFLCKSPPIGRDIYRVLTRQRVAHASLSSPSDNYERLRENVIGWDDGSTPDKCKFVHDHGSDENRDIGINDHIILFDVHRHSDFGCSSLVDQSYLFNAKGRFFDWQRCLQTCLLQESRTDHFQRHMQISFAEFFNNVWTDHLLIVDESFCLLINFFIAAAVLLRIFFFFWWRISTFQGCTRRSHLEKYLKIVSFIEIGWLLKKNQIYSDKNNKNHRSKPKKSFF